MTSACIARFIVFGFLAAIIAAQASTLSVRDVHARDGEAGGGTIAGKPDCESEKSKLDFEITYSANNATQLRSEIAALEAEIEEKVIDVAETERRVRGRKKQLAKEEKHLARLERKRARLDC